MSLSNRSFTLEAITEAEKEARKKEKQELAQLEAQLLDMGYNY